MVVETTKIQLEINTLQEEVKKLRQSFDFFIENNKNLDLSKINENVFKIQEDISQINAYLNIKEDYKVNEIEELKTEIEKLQKDIPEFKLKMFAQIKEYAEKHLKKESVKKETLSLFSRNINDTIRQSFPMIIGYLVIDYNTVINLINDRNYLELLNYCLGAGVIAFFSYLFNNFKNQRKIQEEIKSQ